MQKSITTKNAEENNAENLLVIRDKKLAERYTRYWEEHQRHSEVYAGEIEARILVVTY